MVIFLGKKQMQIKIYSASYPVLTTFLITLPKNSHNELCKLSLYSKNSKKQNCSKQSYP